jgi:hypothetical protein
LKLKRRPVEVENVEVKEVERVETVEAEWARAPTERRAARSGYCVANMPNCFIGEKRVVVIVISRQ